MAAREELQLNRVPVRDRAGRAALLRFAAAMAVGDRGGALRALRRARAAGARRVAAEEVALMLMLHAGYPAALEAMRLLTECWPGRARRSRESGPARWRVRGERLCRRIYGPVFGRLIAHVRAMHPDLAAWMIEQGYGRVLSRPGLADRDRELVAIAVLATGGWERQLVSHLLGAARVGAHPSEIRTAFVIGLRRSRSAAAARRAWRRIDRPSRPP